MSRILLGLLLGFLGYLAVKKLIQSAGLGGPTPPPTGRGESEELVQDPVCQTFIPRKEALTAKKEGQDYFFCSEGCLKRFLRSGNR